jgi:hypothetical protein
LRHGGAGGGGGDGEIAKLRAQVKQLQQEARLKASAAKKEAEEAVKELRTERQKSDRLQTQLRKLENDAGRAGVVGRSRPTSRSPSMERARAPLRSTSRDNSPGRFASGEGPRRGDPPSRGSSAASSRASSRQRTPSPGANRAGSRCAPGGSMRPQVPSPGARLSPYRANSLPRPGRAASPQQDRCSRERTPSPVAFSGQRAGPKRHSPALSVRDRAGAPVIPLGPNITPAKPAIAGRHTGSAASVPGGGSASRPGSLFGLAASLGMGPGAGTASGGGGGAAAASGVLPPVEASGINAPGVALGDSANGCGIDARLQALQSFLKQTKHIAG